MYYIFKPNYTVYSSPKLLDILMKNETASILCADFS